MICRTCKGTGKVDKFVREDFRVSSDGLRKVQKICSDCYGSGKVINKGR